MIRRIFVAINLPDQIKNQIFQLQQPFNLKGIKLVEKKNLHITLAFLGNINDKQLELLKGILSDLTSCYQPFIIDFHGLGIFPGLSRPKIIWIGIKSRQLENLGCQLQRELKRAKLNYDEKKFSSHLTIGRIKFLIPEIKNTLKQQLSRQQNQHFATIIVKTVKIIESELMTCGSRYKSVASFEFLKN